VSDDGLDALRGAPAAPPLGAALEAELGAIAPVAPRRPRRQLAIVAVVSLAYAAGLLAVFTIRRDFDELPAGWIVGAGLAWLAGIALPLYLALVPRGMAPRWPVAAVAAAVASIAFVALGLAIHPRGPNSASLGWEHFGRGHWCLWLGLLTALVPIVLGAMFLRGALPVGSRWIGAALGAGGGCLGGLLLHLHCPIADGQHIGLVHGGVVVVAAAISALLVPRATDRPFR
jgi:hypothetical protein